MKLNNIYHRQSLLKAIAKLRAGNPIEPKYIEEAINLIEKVLYEN